MNVALLVGIAALLLPAVVRAQTCSSISLDTTTSFCGRFFPSPYTAVLPAGDTAATMDTQCQNFYKAVDSLLSRYNCDEQYSFYNCDDCRTAYSRWVCAVKFPKCSGGVQADNIVKPCRDICEDVVRKCPVELNFVCPSKWDQDYSVDPETCNNLKEPPPASAGRVFGAPAWSQLLATLFSTCVIVATMMAHV
eukprot:GFYU01003748.1.p1 GENE.GFYU01003748.1~~GFYU01003748.1.p1  ORF type:complete len:193 (+),score=47.11 GFYU01003748.1:121-699(+)